MPFGSTSSDNFDTRQPRYWRDKPISLNQSSIVKLSVVCAVCGTTKILPFFSPCPFAVFLIIGGFASAPKAPRKAAANAHAHCPAASSPFTSPSTFSNPTIEAARCISSRISPDWNDSKFTFSEVSIRGNNFAVFLAGFVPKVVSLDSATERCVPCEFAIVVLQLISSKRNRYRQRKAIA